MANIKYRVALQFSPDEDSPTNATRLFMFDEFHEAVQFADLAFNHYYGTDAINVAVAWRKIEAPTVAADEA